MSIQQPIRIGIVDDHKLFRKGLISLIESVGVNCEIIFEADDGIDLQKKINLAPPPNIIIMDVNMPRMDGFASVEWLKKNYLDVKVLVVSMIEKEEAIMRMLKLGVSGYLCKDVEPNVLHDALIAIKNKGYYYTDFITGKLVHSLQQDNAQNNNNLININEQEKKFIQLACSELTYVEVADKMFLSPKTIDGYRNSLFEKLKVKSRVGLVIYAIKNGIVRLDSL